MADLPSSVRQRAIRWRIGRAQAIVRRGQLG